MTGFFLSAVRQMEVVWSISRYISYVYKKLKKILLLFTWTCVRGDLQNMRKNWEMLT